MGHESVGEIIKLGNEVTNLKIGDIVAFPAGLHNACGKCYFCINEEEVFCENATFTSSRGYGTMQDECIEKASFCVKVPDGVNLAQACVITCAGLTVYKGLKIAQPKQGDFVAIYCIGGLGNIAIEYAKNIFKTKVIAIGSNKKSLEIAKEKGADYIINWKEENVDYAIKKITNNGVAVALVTSSTSDQFEMAYRNLKSVGKLIAIGLPKAKLEIDIIDLVLTAKQIIGTLVGTRKDLEESLDYFSKGLINPDLVVEPLIKAPEYFKLMEENKLHTRIVFDFNK
ncbi:zinc-binding dehydrogenase [Spiroplasma taiwanense]|uniref:Alcohol dehydrogenase n=1 Tax=Spiroplasma taiwanense CT-1 TaxID=1276220 RepID=S5LVX4_9MOLU|nr:zinc-binding dehydrogenase [Spiroplasma taiwanense]AGR40736.1 alcohol dehydrogenase, propanol-preferring [Spiroplasma taiwanense CT-1]